MVGGHDRWWIVWNDGAPSLLWEGWWPRVCTDMQYNDFMKFCFLKCVLTLSPVPGKVDRAMGLFDHPH